MEDVHNLLQIAPVHQLVEERAELRLRRPVQIGERDRDGAPQSLSLFAAQTLAAAVRTAQLLDEARESVHEEVVH